MSLTPYTPDQIPSRINECVLFSDFRPTAVAFAISDDPIEPRLVLVKSIYEDQDVWWPVQGGLDGKSPELTVSDELSNEISLFVCPDHVKVLGGVDYRTRAKDDFTAGKFLIACTVEYSSHRARMQPNITEVSDLRTVTRKDFNQVMAWNKVNRPETSRKADFFSKVVNSL